VEPVIKVGKLVAAHWALQLAPSLVLNWESLCPTFISPLVHKKGLYVWHEVATSSSLLVA
jgi:hypothetical protein